MIRHLWWCLVWKLRFKALLAQAVDMQCSTLVVFLGNDAFHVMGYDRRGVYARDDQGFVGHITWKDLNITGSYLGRNTYENWRVDLDYWDDSYLHEQLVARIDRLRVETREHDPFVTVQPRFRKHSFMTTRYTIVHGSRIPGMHAKTVWFLSDYSLSHLRLRAYLPFEIDLVKP